MKFHHLTLRVRDFEKSMAFYQKLTGLSVKKQFAFGDGHVAYLHNAEGETLLELIGSANGQGFEGKGMFICFATSNLDAAHAVAVEMGANPSDIRHPEPDARYFYVYDPDGVSVQLREYPDD